MDIMGVTPNQLDKADLFSSFPAMECVNHTLVWQLPATLFLEQVWITSTFLIHGQLVARTFSPVLSMILSLLSDSYQNDAEMPPLSCCVPSISSLVETALCFSHQFQCALSSVSTSEMISVLMNGSQYWHSSVHAQISQTWDWASLTATILVSSWSPCPTVALMLESPSVSAASNMVLHDKDNKIHNNEGKAAIFILLMKKSGNISMNSQHQKLLGDKEL